VVADDVEVWRSASAMRIIEHMFAPPPDVPDLLDSTDAAVRVQRSPLRVWVSLDALVGPRRGQPRRTTPGGLSVTGKTQGLLWARMMSEHGYQLALCTLVLQRADATPVGTTAVLVPEWALSRWSYQSERRSWGKANDRPPLKDR
jgi:hypothetical protein